MKVKIIIGLMAVVLFMSMITAQQQLIPKLNATNQTVDVGAVKYELPNIPDFNCKDNCSLCFSLDHALTASPNCIQIDRYTSKLDVESLLIAQARDYLKVELLTKNITNFTVSFNSII